MSKPRIGLVTNVIDNRRGRGTALVARRFLDQLDRFKDRFDFTLIHYEKTDDPLYKKWSELLMPRVSPIADHMTREAVFWLRYRGQFDVVHYLNPRVWPSYLLTKANKVVVSPLEGGAMMDKPTLGDRVFRFTNKYLNWRMDSIIACSESGKQEIVRYYGVPENKVHSILLGVDDYKRTDRRLFPFLYFLAVSRFDPHKNILRIIKAYKRLQRPDVHLVFVGGDHTPDYSKKVREQIDVDTIRVLPFVEDADMEALYSGAIALVYPSLHEGFGLPVVEAMACGTPVICSNTTSLPEVAGDAALLVNPEETEEIVEAMSRVLTDPELAASLSRAGLEQVKKFSWKRMADEIVNRYQPSSSYSPTL